MKPESVTPLVQTYVRQNHERTNNGYQVGQGQAFREVRQTGLGIQERCKAGDDVDRVGQVELDDV